AGADVALCTSRELVATAGADGNLEIARTVSAALVDVVRRVTAQVRPGWIIGKGGITSSDLATRGLALTRAIARGTLLPGIVSLWDPVSAPGPGAADGPAPLVVFAGNVGDEQALAQTVRRLRGRE
ncbi:MAG: nucleotide-binding domain containing protein, partial [Streptosporangiaceae bacterium]